MSIPQLWVGHWSMYAPIRTEEEVGPIPAHMEGVFEGTAEGAGGRVRSPEVESMANNPETKPTAQGAPPAYRVAAAATRLKAAFAVAVGMNLVEAVWDPGGIAWLVARATVSVIFSVALVSYVVLRVLRWRRARTGRAPS
ncbi:hypothetical protein [Streptomyces sp. LARHCF252]